MSYPEYVLWPHDDELWIHSGGGIYRSLDSVYTREYGDVVDPRMSPIRLAAVSDD